MSTAATTRFHAARISAMPARRRESGQALVEFALVCLLLFVFLFAIIDFSRALLLQQTLASVSREGANLASRGTSLPDTLQAVVTSAQPLDLDTKGYVILTAVSADANGNLSITAQQSRGGSSASSRIGSLGGGANLPVQGLPSPNQTLYVAEVFAGYTPITPLGAILGAAMPSVLYEVAFF